MKLEDAVFEDRKLRRKMSRREYAEATGLTENRVHALEHGRKVKPGEMDALSPFIGDLLGDNVQTQRPVDSMVQFDGMGNGVDYGADDYIAERRGIEASYLTVMERLKGLEAPPISWPSRYRIETAPPSDFPDIRDWIKKVHEWIDGQRGAVDLFDDDPEPLPTDGPEYHAEHEAWEERQANEVIYDPPVVDDEYDEDEDDEEGIAGFETTHEPREELKVTEVEVIPGLSYDAPRYVTNGELQTWKDCRRRWYLGNYRQLGPVTGERYTGSAAVGTRYHEALAAWYQPQPGDPWAVFEASTAEGLDFVDENDHDDFLRETDLVRAMIEGYFQWVEETGVDRGLTVVGSEHVVIANPKFPEFPRARVLGKLDVKVVRDWDGTRWFLDHKTVGDFTTPTRTLHMDEQMLQYHLIERLSEDQEGWAAGALYNMARKVKRTASANPPFYAREETRFNREFVQSYWIRTRQTLGEIEVTTDALNAGADHRAVAYPRPTRDCAWKCPYFQVCPMFDDGSRAEDYLADHFVTVNPLERYRDALREMSREGNDDAVQVDV